MWFSPGFGKAGIEAVHGIKTAYMAGFRHLSKKSARCLLLIVEWQKRSFLTIHLKKHTGAVVKKKGYSGAHQT